MNSNHYSCYGNCHSSNHPSPNDTIMVNFVASKKVSVASGISSCDIPERRGSDGDDNRLPSFLLHLSVIVGAISLGTTSLFSKRTVNVSTEARGRRKRGLEMHPITTAVHAPGRIRSVAGDAPGHIRSVAVDHSGCSRRSTTLQVRFCRFRRRKIILI